MYIENVKGRVVEISH